MQNRYTPLRSSFWAVYPPPWFLHWQTLRTVGQGTRVSWQTLHLVLFPIQGGESFMFRWVESRAFERVQIDWSFRSRWRHGSLHQSAVYYVLSFLELIFSLPNSLFISLTPSLGSCTHIHGPKWFKLSHHCIPPASIEQSREPLVGITFITVPTIPIFSCHFQPWYCRDRGRDGDGDDSASTHATAQAPRSDRLCRCGLSVFFYVPCIGCVQYFFVKCPSIMQIWINKL